MTIKEVAFLAFFFFGHTPTTWKFPGQGLDLCHSSDSRCYSDNTGSLAHYATMGTPKGRFLTRGS